MSLHRHPNKIHIHTKQELYNQSIIHPITQQQHTTHTAECCSTCCYHTLIAETSHCDPINPLQPSTLTYNHYINHILKLYSREELQSTLSMSERQAIVQGQYRYIEYQRIQRQWHRKEKTENL